MIRSLQARISLNCAMPSYARAGFEGFGLRVGLGPFIPSVVSCMAGCQNHDPFWGTLNIRCRTLKKGSKKGPFLVTTTPIALRVPKPGEGWILVPSIATMVADAPVQIIWVVMQLPGFCMCVPVHVHVCVWCMCICVHVCMCACACVRDCCGCRVDVPDHARRVRAREPEPARKRWGLG